jgi:MFS family permease
VTARAVQPASHAVPPGRELRTGLALVAVCLGFFVIQLDVTIVNVALPTIQRDIGGSTGSLQWIIDSYTSPWPRSS